jgi:hypothetical protein
VSRGRDDGALEDDLRALCALAVATGADITGELAAVRRRLEAVKSKILGQREARRDAQVEAALRGEEL